MEPEKEKGTLTVEQELKLLRHANKELGDGVLALQLRVFKDEKYLISLQTSLQSLQGCMMDLQRRIYGEGGNRSPFNSDNSGGF